MRPFFTLAMVCLLAVSRAVSADNESPETRYVKVYGLMQQAERLTENGKAAAATAKYADALALLKQLKADYPEWNAKVVKYRLDYLTAKQAAAPAKPAPSASGAQLLPADPNEMVDMKLRWEVGKRYLQRVETAQNTEVTMPGQKQPLKQDNKTTQDFAISVLKERDGGGRELELEFLAPNPAGQSAAGDATADMLRKLAGARVKYLTDANGKIESVQGFAELFDRLTEGMPAAAKEMVKGMFTEDNLKDMTSLNQGLPGKPVKVGDNWPVKNDLALGPLGKMTVAMNYTFKGWVMQDNKKCALLEFTGSVSNKPDDSSPTAGLITIDQGKTSGKSWFDPATGMVVATAANQDITVKLKTGAESMSTRMHQVVNGKLLEIADAAK